MGVQKLNGLMVPDQIKIYTNLLHYKKLSYNHTTFVKE